MGEKNFGAKSSMEPDVKPRDLPLNTEKNAGNPPVQNIKPPSTLNEGSTFVAKSSPKPDFKPSYQSLKPNVAEWQPLEEQQGLSVQHANQDHGTVYYYPDQTQSVVNSMAELLRQQVEQTVSLTLPQPDLPVFSGDPIEYNNFVRAFESLIEAKTSSSSSRLFYLIQYTDGDVKELMRSCLSMEPNQGCKTARQLLKNKYGQSYKIATAHVDKIINSPTIKAEDGPALQRYSVLLTSCKKTLKETGFINKIENPDTLQKIIQRLPFNLRQRWRDKADEISENEKKEVNIEDIANFIDVKARAANHPIFGTLVSDSKNIDIAKPRQRIQQVPRKASTYAAHGHAQPSSSSEGSAVSNRPKPSVKCHMCEGEHWMSRCETFKAKSFDERRKFVRQKGLCDNCLQTGHMAKSCPK